MQPRLEARDAFTVIGLKWRGSDGPAQIPAHWDLFLPWLQELLPHSPNGRTYGVERDFDKATGEYSYLACVEVAAGTPAPAGLEVWEIPASLYAIFPARLSNIPQVYIEATTIHLPAGEWRLASDISLEDYGADFDGENLELWFPVVAD